MLDEIAIHHRQGRTPTQIKRELDRIAVEWNTDMAVDARKDHLAAPSLSTVKRIIKELQPATPERQDKQWSLHNDDTGEPAVVLETLAAVIESSAGGVTSFDMEVARMIARIGGAFPDLPIIDRWSFATLYLVRRETGRRTDDLDSYLAFAPWRGDEDGLERQETYERAIRLGWIPRPPRYFRADLHRAATDPEHVKRDVDWATMDQAFNRAMAKPGARLEFGRPLTDEEMRTTLPGLFPPVSNPVSND